ncbi:MAG: malonyl-ACP O-methyltransferase BioC [Candidatus Omnitrophica bacterium]|nr:malonyl-ACP O-methyltransferase BioC [Candidatus Omnitrophota bacterium]
MIDKNLVKINFSRWARFYDQYAFIQSFCAEKMIEQLKNDDFDSIIDIGCGTGIYTFMLKQLFPESAITAIDISPAMILEAKKKMPRGVRFSAADSEVFKPQEKYDLITSNVSLQWIQNLRIFFKKYKKHLNPQGTFFVSMFGPGTFYELQETFENFFKEEITITSNEFAGKGYLESVMEEVFKESIVEQFYYTQKFSSLKELLKSIKYTGARGFGLNNRITLTENRLLALEHLYRQEFKNITATYQVFFCRGVL